ncbi:MAG TPA: YqaJ viral recombinase family protein [Vicinamibacterales bacterium]
MNRQTITPASESDWLALRINDITSTDVSALFGMSPYKTKYELWHEKKAATRAPFVENERVVWGKRLQAVVAEGIAQDKRWVVRPFKEYVRLPDCNVGSSFDYVVLGESSAADQILEIKTVDALAFKNGWIVEDDYIEAPAHIELQVQHQLLVSGLTRAYIGALVGGNTVRVIERDADPAVHRGILAAAREFWESIAANRPPPPVMPDDAPAVIRMNQYAEPGKFFDGRGDAEFATLMQEYKRLGDVEKEAKEAREVIKAQVLEKIGSAEKVLVDGGTISASLVGPAEIPAFTRKPFRNFRFTPARAK